MSFYILPNTLHTIEVYSYNRNHVSSMIKGIKVEMTMTQSSNKKCQNVKITQVKKAKRRLRESVLNYL